MRTRIYSDFTHRSFTLLQLRVKQQAATAPFSIQKQMLVVYCGHPWHQASADAELVLVPLGAGEQAADEAAGEHVVGHDERRSIEIMFAVVVLLLTTAHHKGCLVAPAPVAAVPRIIVCRIVLNVRYQARSVHFFS